MAPRAVDEILRARTGVERVLKHEPDLRLVNEKATELGISYKKHNRNVLLPYTFYTDSIGEVSPLLNIRSAHAFLDGVKLGKLMAFEEMKEHIHKVVRGDAK